MRELVGSKNTIDQMASVLKTLQKVTFTFTFSGTAWQGNGMGAARCVNRPLECFKMGSIGCPEMSVINYQSMLRNIPEEPRSHRNKRCYTYIHPTYETVLMLCGPTNSS